MIKNTMIEYVKGNESIFYSKYFNKKYSGFDRVLQHKISGVETAHVTIHPDSNPQVTVRKTVNFLKQAVATKLAGYSPPPSKDVSDFINKVKVVVQAS